MRSAAERRTSSTAATRARELAPDVPKLDLLGAEAHARAGQRAAAIADLERYLARAGADEPGIPRARELLSALRP